VYLCEVLKHDRKVALKLLKPELAAVLGAERFVQEIKTTAALQHPHILPLFDSGTADGRELARDTITIPHSAELVWRAPTTQYR
jgi:serine/threonine protein kinase